MRENLVVYVNMTPLIGTVYTDLTTIRALDASKLYTYDIFHEKCKFIKCVRI